MTIKFSTDNAAFHCPEEYADPDLNNRFMAREMGDLFTKICNDVKSGKTSGSILDVNGNKIGSWKL